MNYFRQMMNLHGKFKYFFLCLFFAGSHSIAFSQDIPAIIPRPVEINMEAGHFIINENRNRTNEILDFNGENSYNFQENFNKEKIRRELENVLKTLI